jgi:DNA-binding protein H-NS
LEDDPKFIQLNTYFEDMKKNFQLNLDILDEINTKLNQLANRRKVREQQAKEQVDFFEEMSDYKRKEEEIEKKKEERKLTT